jgi:trehalose synthase
VEAYRLVKREISGVQLALIGAMAGDDPEGWRLLDLVQEESARDPDLFVFTNVAGVGSMGVNIFQRGCDVVIQKSIREGFGLVVSEALRRGKGGSRRTRGRYTDAVSRRFRRIPGRWD